LAIFQQNDSRNYFQFKKKLSLSRLIKI